MDGQTNLLDVSPPAVVPEQPPPGVRLIDREWLVAGVPVPLIGAGADDRVGLQPPPIRDAVFRAGDADLRMVHVAEADVEHHPPLALLHHLAGGHFASLPW